MPQVRQVTKQRLGPRQLLPLSCTKLVLRSQPCVEGVNVRLEGCRLLHPPQDGAHECNRRADLEVLNMRVGQTDLLVDVTLRHDFFGAGRDGGINHGKLCNPDHPDQILEGAAADKIRNCRNPYRQNRLVAFLPACMPTSGRIHGELLRLLFFLANKRADDYFQDFGYQPDEQEYFHPLTTRRQRPTHYRDSSSLGPLAPESQYHGNNLFPR